ncbi:MAG: FAD-binding oxidoreductase [Bdellovibrio sp.]|nr:FAD-binding oxidoreductase [Bdellovibrio sp.]
MTHSYWLDSAVHFSSSDFTSVKSFDVIIVGAGIAGLSTAYWLEKENPSIKIAIVDRAGLGRGASGRNAGFVTCGSAEHFSKLEKQFGLSQAIQIWKFSDANRELLKAEIIQGDSALVDFSQTGSCTVAASESDWQRYHRLSQTMLVAGLDVELIDEKYLSDRYGVRNFLGAIQYKNDGEIHPVKLLGLLKSKLRQTKFIFDSNVTELKRASHSWIVSTSKDTLSADKVIFCLNGYSDAVLPELKELVKPQRGQVIVTEPLKKFVQGPCYLTKHLCYFRQLPTGELLIGGFRNHDIEAENTKQDEVTPKIQAALKEFAHSYFQNTSGVKINYQWSGVMGFTSDGQMMIGEHPSQKGVYLMAGCSGHGMGLSFHAALTLVNNIKGKNVPAHLDIQRFRAQLL